MSNDLSVIQEALPAVATDDAVFNELTKASDYLPRVQLYGSNSELVKEGKFPMGEYGIVRDKETVDELGKQFNCIPLCFRFRATRFGDEVVNFYDPNSEGFKQIMTDADGADSGCMFGVEFLLWLDEKQEFTTYFMASKSARREAGNLRKLVGQGATIDSRLIKTKKYSWHAPRIIACSDVLNVPSAEDVATQVNAFTNPREEDAASSEETAATDRER